MDTQLKKKLQALLSEIYHSRDNFYKKKFLQAGIEKKDIGDFDLEVFNKLPMTTVKDLENTPYNKRCLKEEQGLNKLVYLKNINKFILMHRTLREIKENPIPLNGFRPMVILQDLYESLEYCLSFYQQKRIPLIGEITNPAILYATASQYRIDSLVLDIASKKLFQTELFKLKLSLKAVTVVDSFFSPEGLAWPKTIDCNYSLSLPEFGKIAFLCKEAFKKGFFLFHSFRDVFIEPGEKTVLTSVNLQACPMIRYQSNLHLEARGSCICSKQAFRAMQD